MSDTEDEGFDPVLAAVFDAGRAAFAAGQPSTAALELYPADSDERLVWVRGWTRARRDAGVRAPRLPQED
jgi:hypothetical protein